MKLFWFVVLFPLAARPSIIYISFTLDCLIIHYRLAGTAAITNLSHFLSRGTFIQRDVLAWCVFSMESFSVQICSIKRNSQLLSVSYLVLLKTRGIHFLIHYFLRLLTLNFPSFSVIRRMFELNVGKRFFTYFPRGTTSLIPL